MAAGQLGNAHLLSDGVSEEDAQLLDAYASGMLQAGEVLVRRFSIDSPGGCPTQAEMADICRPEFARLQTGEEDVKQRHGPTMFPVSGLHGQEISLMAVDDHSTRVTSMPRGLEAAWRLQPDAGEMPVLDHVAHFCQPDSVQTPLPSVFRESTRSHAHTVYNDFCPMLQEIDQLSRAESNDVNFTPSGDGALAESFTTRDFARLCRDLSAAGVHTALEQITQGPKDGSSRDRKLCMLLGLVVVVLQQIMSLLPTLESGRKRQRLGCAIQQHLHDIEDESRRLSDEEDDEYSRLLPVVSMYQVNLNSLLLAIAKDGEELESAPEGMSWFSKHQLGMYDDDKWIESLRMTAGTLKYITESLRPHCTKQITNFKKPICVELKVAACIFKLVNGSTLAKTSAAFHIGKATVYDIMREIIPAIVKVFGQRITWPSGSYMHEIMDNFQKRTGLSNCLGAIGTCHISILQHSSKMHDRRNKKHNISYTVQAVCDHNLRFTDVFVSTPSYGHDSKVSRTSVLWKLANNFLVFNDSPDTFPSGVPFPSYILGDSTFPNLHRLITPFKHYGRRPLTEAEKDFNHRVHLGQGLVEKAFTVLKSNFQELARPSRLAAGYLPKVITACMCLYNVLLDVNDLDTTSVMSQEMQDSRRIQSSHQVMGPSGLHKDEISGDMLREGLIDFLQRREEGSRLEY